MRIVSHTQTLTVMMSYVGLFMLSAAAQRNLKDQIYFNDNILREKFESNDKNQLKQRELIDEKKRSMRNKSQLGVEKLQAEQARIAMEYQLKYKRSEEYARLRRPESSTALVSSSVRSIPPEPLDQILS